MISWPVFESRLPVGSSASRIDGLLTRARAIATRWRWPPDSSLGRWRHADGELDAFEGLLGALARASFAGTPA